MELPNYFLADLPPGATPGAGMLQEACRTLKANRERYLLPRRTESLIAVLSRLAAEWLEADNPFRRMALTQGPAQTGFSRTTLERGLDSFFKSVTAESLRALIEQEFGHHQRLDHLVSSNAEIAAGRAAIAIGPEFMLHFAAGNVPNPAWMSLLLGLLTRSAQFMKCARGSSFLPRLFAHSIYAADHKLGACLEVAEWKGGNDALESALFAEADCVTATGGDEALASIRGRLPARTRFIAYGHRVSFAYVGANLLNGLSARRVLARAVDDLVAWNQLGCLSPHAIYVQTGGALAPEAFAAQLATELAAREEIEPRGPLPPEVAATIASRRSFYEVRAAHSEDTLLWCSPQSTAWTVVFEMDPLFQTSCLNRFVYVKSAASIDEVLRAAESVRGKVSTVGVAVTEDAAQEIGTTLARWGVTRVCPLGKMQKPPLTWRHDGRPALGDFITWTDWEVE